MTLEGIRKLLGNGAFVNFLINDNKQGVEMHEGNKILRIGGFHPD